MTSRQRPPFTKQDAAHGVTLEDLKGYYVKWQTFHYTIDGENWFEVDLADWEPDRKRPSDVNFYAIDDEYEGCKGNMLEDVAEWKEARPLWKKLGM